MNKWITYALYSIFWVLFLVIFINIIFPAEYGYVIDSMFYDCIPDEAGIYENEIYHHVPGRCSKYFDKIFLDESKDTKKLDSKIYVKTNSLGFRNKEYSIKKDDDTIRIILLGDSYTYGFGVKDEDTFYQVLEEDLNKICDNKIEIWNIGYTSWGTVTHYLLIKNKVVGYDPDLVILMYDYSDFHDNIMYESMGLYEEDILVGINNTDQEWWDRRIEVYDERINTFGGDETLLWSNLSKTSFYYINFINELLLEENVPFEVIVYPYKFNYGDESRYGYLFSLLDEENIIYYSLFSEFNKSNIEIYYSEKHSHWNEEGSRYVAELLEEHIKEKIQCN